MRTTLLLLVGSLVSTAPWDMLDDLNWEHLLSKVECLWQYGYGMCHDWHRR